MTEIWRTVDVCPAYEVSSEGRIRRVLPGKRTRVGNIVRSEGDTRYRTATLVYQGKRHYVHIAANDCRYPFAHDADSCDCRPRQIDCDIARFERNAEFREELARKDRVTLLAVWAVTFLASLAVLAVAAHSGLSREAEYYRAEARV